MQYTEWRDARAATWQTTLLGLGNEVGQLVSMTHPDIPGLHGTCNVTGTSVTWASGDAFVTSMKNKEVVINGVQVLITGYTTDPTYQTVTGLLLASAPGNGTNLPFQIVTMSFRIQRWTLKKDWSVQIEGQTVTDSMYDLDVGPKPMDVVPAPLPPSPGWRRDRRPRSSW